jgi:hypothetical protein
MTSFNNQNVLGLIFKSLRRKEKYKMAKLLKNSDVLSGLLNTLSIDCMIDSRGIQLFKSNEYAKALVIFEKNISLDKEHISSLYFKALCLYYLNRPIDALGILNDDRFEGYEEAMLYRDRCRLKVVSKLKNLNGRLGSEIRAFMGSKDKLI